MDRLWQALWWLLSFPLAAIFRVHAWFGTRRWSLLLISSPAWLLGIAVFALVIYARYSAGREIVGRYDAAFNQALNSADDAAVEMTGRKLLQLDSTNPDARYALALLTERNGDPRRAEELMRDLAPEDAIGHPRAHFWTAQRMLAAASRNRAAANSESPSVANATRSLDASDFRALIHHLSIAVRLRSQQQAAHLMLAQLWLASRNFERAAEHLEAVVAQRPDLRMTLGDVYLAAGDKDRAHAELTQAADYLRRVVEADPTNWRARIVLAQALAKREDVGEAARVLSAGLGSDPEGQVRLALASLCVAQYDRMEKSGQGTIGNRLAFLQRALAYAPNHLEALTRLAAFSQRTGDDAAQARSMLKDALARGEAPAAVHLILGTSAASSENWQEATMHLEQAQRLNPRSPAILNNLAWVLASGKPPQLQRALELSNAAIELAPGHPEMLATRGHILMLLERWSDSLVDLEAALAGLGTRGNLHESLAVVYDKLGDQELARRHRELAQAADKQPANESPTAQN